MECFFFVRYIRLKSIVSIYCIVPVQIVCYYAVRSNICVFCIICIALNMLRCMTVDVSHQTEPNQETYTNRAEHFGSPKFKPAQTD